MPRCALLPTLALSLVLGSLSLCFGQTYTSNLTGLVTDPSGSPVPGVTIRGIHHKYNSIGQSLSSGDWVSRLACRFNRQRKTNLPLIHIVRREMDARLHCQRRMPRRFITTAHE